MVFWGLKSLLEELEAPKDLKLIDYAERAVMKKAFRFEELPQKWEEFCSYLQDIGESFATFLSTILNVTAENGTLTLYTGNAFYKEWILEENNKRCLLNILSFYTEAPAAIKLCIEVGVEEAEKKLDLKSKLQKRYENLVE